jgi:hypothetical protein
MQFAIRPTIRNHGVMKRMDIIQKVASIVGPGHQVDLKNADLLIMVEVYTVSRCFRIPCGMYSHPAEHLWYQCGA